MLALCKTVTLCFPTSSGRRCFCGFSVTKDNKLQFFFAAAEGTTVSGTATDQFHNIISKYRWLRSTARNQKDLASYDIQLREAILF